MVLARLLCSCLVVVLSSSSVAAFHPAGVAPSWTTGTSSRILRLQSTNFDKRCTQLFLYSEPKEPENHADENSVAESPSILSKSIVGDASIAPNISDALSTLKTGLIYLFAMGVMIGLILNLFGYAYILSPNEGFRIDTLSELQMEQQLQVGGLMKQSPDGVSQFFLKNPFTTSLMITGFVLAYEGCFLDKRKK
jgi:hypothetical protein